ncbi:hypothetical protein [Pseudomonas sp. p106]|uniref:hypothetical protein n=1 Tax=Pseudomonas sp. p106 TaxID=2479854 RepID=UPI000F76BDE0|nr:hypothetical protein [Pseudomonas sp. p106]RRV45793.1 hypothetical protein EGJ09_12270 [Pseudomonas sp. p106]
MHEEEEVVSISERTATELAQELRVSLDELGWSAAGLMDRMRSLGDYRTAATILRGINRALEGQIKPSGELMALVQQAVRFQRRLLRTYSNTPWSQLGDGSYTTRLEDFTLTITPQSRGRWRVNLIHKDGFSPPFPRWQDSLDAAKRMAFITLDNGQNWLQEYAEQQAREAAEKTAVYRGESSDR